MAHSRSNSEVCTWTLHDPLGPAESLQTSSHDSTPGPLAGRHRGAGLSPSTERHSASQATAGSEQSGHAVTGGAARAAISWASSPRHRRRSRADICDQACGRPSLSVEIHVRRAAARRLSSRRAASQRRGSGDHTPGRKCMCDCAGGAVLKKIAARFSFRGLRARKDTISICYRVTRCDTGHSCCRAAHWHTACV